MVHQTRSSLTPSIPTLGGVAAGAGTALVAAAMPAAWLEAMVEGSGIAALLPVAAPPLGVTARAVLALGGGVAIAGVVWAALYLLFGPGGPFAAKPQRSGDAPAVRRADAHPDAPPRWPVTAAELTAAELPLPRDLDRPLAAYDPDALPPVPMAPAQSLKPLAPALAPGERIDTFPLAPPPPAPAAVNDEPPSIDALLRRLEQGARRRAAA